MFSFSKSNGGEGMLFGVGQFFLGKLRYITHPSFGVPFFARGYCSVDKKTKLKCQSQPDFLVSHPSKKFPKYFVSNFLLYVLV